MLRPQDGGTAVLWGPLRTIRKINGQVRKGDALIPRLSLKAATFVV